MQSIQVDLASKCKNKGQTVELQQLINSKSRMEELISPKL